MGFFMLSSDKTDHKHGIQLQYDYGFRQGPQRQPRLKNINMAPGGSTDKSHQYGSSGTTRN